MTKTQVEVITSVQRRRRWSRVEKERIVAAALEPGAVASEVAREAGIHTSQLFRWRQQLCKRTPAPVAFNPVAVSPVPEAVALRLPVPSPEQAGTVDIEFATGGRMRITGSVDASTVSALLLSTRAAIGSARLHGWGIFRLFLMPFCVSSFSALVKDRGFILIFAPNMQENLLALALCVAFVSLVTLLRGKRPRAA